MAERADDPLVTRARQGDADAWRELHRRHAGRLVVWLRTRPTGDVGASADDVASEAWLVAASKIADFTGTADEFGGWLFGIARKLAANARRTHERRDTHATDDLTPHGSVPDLAPRVESQQWLTGLLSELPPRERDAVALVDGLGMDRAEAARVLGVSAVTLRVARHRGLKKLEARLAASVIDGEPG